MMSASGWAQLPDVVDAPVEHVFVPKGFDNNDTVELVVTGSFPSPCYTRNKVEVQVTGDLIRVSMTSLSKQDARLRLCEPLKVPFTEVVTVGNLQGGNYQIVVNQGTRFELRSGLFVETSQSQSVDDHLYALVEYVELGFTGGLSGDAELVARAISPCLKLDRVEYLSNGKDTLSIMPIMKKVRAECPERSRRITIPIKFNPREFPHEKLLLFVRSVEGRSIHSIIQK
jgi:hypothetical protein